MDTAEITLLDGGMGRELKAMGAPFGQPEWSALALMQSPQSVSLAHQRFIEAGAEVITTNSYAVCPFHIGDSCWQQRGFELASLAGELARKAADEAANVRVAGSLPPCLVPIGRISSIHSKPLPCYRNLSAPCRPMWISGWLKLNPALKRLG